MSQTRQPRGIPVGGQFAQNQHDEAPGGLGSGSTVPASEIQKGDLVDMTPLVSSYIAGSYDGVIDGDDDGTQMEGIFTVSDVEPGPSGSVRLVLSSPDYSYDWYVNPGTEVPLVSRMEPSQTNSQAGLASWASSPQPQPQQHKIGYSTAPELVSVETPAFGTGATHNIGVSDGGSLTMYSRDLPVLDGDSFDHVTLTNRGGKLVAEGAIFAGAFGDTSESHVFEQNRDRINARLADYGMRLPDTVPDWSKVRVISDMDMSGYQTTYTDEDGKTRPHVYTDNIADAVRDTYSSAHGEWIRDGHLAQSIRQHIGLPLR